jgi:hypothetical protein
MNSLNDPTDAGQWHFSDDASPSTKAKQTSGGDGQVLLHPPSGTTTSVSDLSAAPSPVLPATPTAKSSLDNATPVALQQALAGSDSLSHAPAFSLAWAAAVVVPLLLIVLCTAAVVLVSRLGWRRFARRYPDTTLTADETAFTATLVRFFSPLRSRRDSVRVTLSREGLRFANVRPRPWSQAGFAVPWTSVAAVLRRHGPSGPRYRIEIDDPAGRILVKIRADLAPVVREYWKPTESAQTIHDDDGRGNRPRYAPVRPLEPEVQGFSTRPLPVRLRGRARAETSRQ